MYTDLPEVPTKSYRLHAWRKDMTRGKSSHAIFARKEGWVGILDEKADKKARKDEVCVETFQRRMNEILRSEAEWKFQTYEDYYKTEDMTKALVFNQWEHNYLRVKESLMQRRKAFHKKPLHWFVNEYNREMQLLELEYGDVNYPWKPLQIH